MEVICIDNKAKKHPDCLGDWMVKEGESYTVLDGFEQDGEYFYILKEDAHGNGWNSIYFIPLSNITETVINYEKTRV
jgi:hypothetical protein